MSRAFLVVLDSVGCGGAPDAARFGDDGANTLGHIHQTVGLRMPNLMRLGLAQAAGLSDIAGEGLFGVAREVSMGKDTPSGHWELAGVPVPWDWHYFPDTHPAFPPEITAEVAKFCGTDGVLGDCHASGTQIIERLGEEHMRTGKPICYTSADSVFQIAAHEESFGLERLQDICRHMAPMLHAMKVGRVISRPFLGQNAADFKRTSNRHDYAMEIPSPTLLDWAKADGRATYGVGKIGDIFSGRGVDENRKGFDDALMGHLSDLVDEAPDGALVFANFVEFDSLYGHRREPEGYATHLEWFDEAIGPVLEKLRKGDLMLFTADHGNDPTWHGTEHTREQVPVVAAGVGRKDIGQVMFVDVAASVADHLGLSERGPGRSFL
ncbi:phosphopentomutase [Litoreibacter arenae]|uniref:Phosphopentomutase n=1 Tax=Litoreibacter arenae DSM 19593 TaxID=1123360 RepID=S9RSL6_9RHOB|nr:phosphopentomutase [Litoreibacter arenae]EPX81050.1 Phosphopentomutase [Litoreibacter arenae DSM 19593]